MRATIEGRVCAVINRQYTKDGERQTWREVHIATSMTEAPEQVRVDGNDPSSLGAFSTLLEAAWLAPVRLAVETQRFGSSMSLTLRGAEVAEEKPAKAA